MKKVLFFGSTGSIGESALEVIRKDKRNFKVLGLLANRNVRSLAKQIKEFRPSYVCVVDVKQAKVLKRDLPRGIKLFSGQEGVRDFSAINSDISIMGIVGISSLKPLLMNISAAKRIALASKEALVTAGSLVKEECAKFNTEIIPIDSEINALFQLFKFVDRAYLNKVYLTASGGPLLDYTNEQLRKVSKKKVLSHPTWRMGRRVTVDSTTLVNKGFEVMETHYLFDLDYSCIDIVIHRESCVHAFLETKDNTLFACIYTPNMKIPIAFSLYYPERFSPLKGLDFSFSNINLSFDNVDCKKFSLLDIIIESAKRGGSFPVIINAADEVAIDYFLKGKIRFYDIYKTVEYIFTKIKKAKVKNLDDIYFWDEWARIKTKEFLNSLKY